MKLIDLDDALVAIASTNGSKGDMLWALYDLPNVDPRPKGKWIEYMDCEGKSRKITCDKCGHEEWNWLNPNFCSDCGADMRHER